MTFTEELRGTKVLRDRMVAQIFGQCVCKASELTADHIRNHLHTEACTSRRVAQRLGLRTYVSDLLEKQTQS